MPRGTFTEQYSGSGDQVEKFAQLKLERVGDYGRIACPEGHWTEWVHELKAPIIQPDGTPKMTLKTRQRSGEQYPDYELEFLSRSLCLGLGSVLEGEGRGSDPRNCPACAAAVSGGHVLPAVRRFSMNIVQYATRNQPDVPLLQPFQARILVWAFTQRTFDRILAIQAQWGPLREHDLVVGPLEDPAMFQRFAIAPLPDAAHQQNIDYIRQLWVPEQRATDEQLRAACGRTQTLEWMNKDITTIADRWARITGQSGGSPAFASGFGPTRNGAEGAAGPTGQAAPVSQGDPFAQPSSAGAPSSAGPTGGGAPASPGQPLAAAAPSQPGQPVAQGAPTTPGDPFADIPPNGAPTTPVPLDGAQAAGLDQFRTGEQSDPFAQPQAADPATPAAPATPASPAVPATPAAPAQPASPAQPVNPPKSQSFDDLFDVDQ